MLGIDTIIPNEADKDYIHDSIFNELTKGIFKDETKNKYVGIIDKLKSYGAEGVVFGSAEFHYCLLKLIAVFQFLTQSQFIPRQRWTVHYPNDDRGLWTGTEVGKMF